MAEIRCPMCSKPNPEELDVCQFCGARLKPLIVSSSQDAPFHPDAGPAEGKEGNEIPEWLENLRSKAQSGATEPPDEAEPLNVPDSEDWLSRLGKTPDEGAVEQNQPADEHGSGPSGSIAQRGDLQEKSTDGSIEGSTDWPATAPEQTEASVQEDAAVEDEAPAEPESISEETQPGEMPDWLAKIKAESDLSPQEASDNPVFTSESPGETLEGSPDWLARLSTEASAPRETERNKPTFKTEPDSSLPEKETPRGLLRGRSADSHETGDASEEVSPVEPEKESEIPIHREVDNKFSMDVPEWLSDIQPEDSKSAKTGDLEKKPDRGEDEGTPGLEPAELPSWVQAMRPVESVVEDAPTSQAEAEQTVENQGPLAGLMGVLPIEPGLGAIRKPPAYSIKLKMNEDQQRHAEHLERLVNAETASKSLPTAAKRSSVHLLRWIISALLFVAIGFPLLSGIQITPPTSLRPPEMMAALDVISRLPPNAPILIIFDYEPALSGELEAAAAPMVDQLLFTGARLTFLSTSPTGPILAERFLQLTQAVHDYQSGQNYVNLGYLAGGPAGILSFAQNPSLTAPETIYGEQAWTLPPLQGVNSLDDFQVFILLTENADTARTWIEQADTFLGMTPTLMAISAQAEPMIRPFYDSGQVDGLVTGLAGGKAYEQTIQRPGLAHTYWNSFSAGLFVAIIMIVCGGLWNTVAVLRTRRASPGKEK